MAKGKIRDLSKWGMANSITRYSQDADVSYDRATELEAIGGKVLDLKPSQWKSVQEAA